MSNQRTFLENVAKQLNMKDQSSWYRISPTMLENLGSSGLLRKYNNSMGSLLQTVYPEYLKMRERMRPFATLSCSIQLGSFEVCSSVI